MKEREALPAPSGALETAVRAVLVLVRTLWDVYAESGLHSKSGRDEYILVEKECVVSRFRSQLHLGAASDGGSDFGDTTERLASKVIERLNAFVSWPDGVDVDFFSPYVASRRLLGRTSSDVDYFVRRTIRLQMGLHLSAEAARLVHAFCTATRGSSLRRPYSDFIAKLTAVCGRPWQARAFADLCAAAASIRPCGEPGQFCIPSGALDPDALLSQLFGFPTSITGFDEMFGGGGLMLADAAKTADLMDDRIGGRTVLTRGPFGSAKTLLSLLIAVEVARKGGVAWVVAQEQTAEELCCSLEAIGVSTSDPAFRLVRDPIELMGALTVAGQGALILLPFDVRNKNHRAADPFENLLKELESKFTLFANYPLRLVVVDPVNSFAAQNATCDVLRRGKAADLLRKAKRHSVNLWFNSEQADDSGNPGQFEENIADTVIHLGFEHPHGAQLRYIEVTKSRLQREQPGRHSLWITSDVGLRITARTYAGDLAIKAVGERSSENPYDVGIPGLQKVLGPRSVVPGDIIAFDGPTGTSKTLTGVLFLTGGASEPGSCRSLMISDFSTDRMCELVRIAVEQARAADDTNTTPNTRPEAARRTGGEIEMYSVPLGLSDPGRLLLEVERRLEKCRSEGRPVDRVLVANISRWGLEMPLLAGDLGFGVALIKLLRKYRTTAVIVTGYSDPSRGSPLIDVILESADCQIQFSRLDFRGQDRHYIRIVKTRDMNHRRGRFELVDRNRIMVMPRESLVRVAPDNRATAVPIRLFLHSETANHDHYNERLISALQTTISPGIKIVPANRRYDTNVLQLASFSAIDELQILQLDEFQLPPRKPDKDAAEQFVQIDRAHVAGRLPSLLERVEGYAPGQYLAVPLYENISFLAYRNKAALPSSWVELAEECERWERDPRTPEDGIYFACPVARVDRYETYNCLFFEILSSFRTPPESGSLIEWLSGDDAIRALMIFRKLLHRYHAHLTVDDGSDVGKWRGRHNQLTKQALVWRAWYTSFNQSLSEIPESERAGISVTPLFGYRGDPAGMTTSGEWYLAVPAFSAAREIALEIIDFLTTPERELERLHLGVGLPVRSCFYTDLENLSSRYYESDDLTPSVVEGLIAKAFRRSMLRNYPALSDIISSHLIRTLYISAANERAVERELRRTLSSMLRSFTSIGGSGKQLAGSERRQGQS